MKPEFPRPPAWTRDALCAEIDGEMWFPEKGQDGGQAKRICGMCPVINECLQYAIQNGEKAGIWGGLNVHQRNRLARATNTRSTAA